VMEKGGVIVMSGFYLDDLPAIRARANELGLSFDHLREMDRWVATTFVKK